jgi:hypothetical protein
MNVRRIGFLGLLMVAAALSRVVPHPNNVAPMAAVALFGAAVFRRRWVALVMPFAVLLFSDLLIEITHRLVQGTPWEAYQRSWGFYSGQWLNYACLLVTVGLGFLLRNRRTAGAIASVALLNAVLFFLLSNFLVWAQGSGSMYPKTFQGLMLCYEMALPFFRNSLLGDAFYVTLLFGALALAEARFPILRKPALAAA